MSTLFSGPPKMPKPPVLKPPRNTALDAEQAALAKRQGATATLLTGPGGKLAGTPNVLGHQLTGQ
jgi:hypothetical protein